MIEEVLEFENTVEDEAGRSHVALVLGEEREDGRWVGRIRFTPTDGEPPLETGRETTQPKREYLLYWARGLTYFYLEGALARARRQAEGAGSGSARATGGKAEASPASRTGRTAPAVPRLEVASPAAAVVDAVMGVRDPGPGTVREIPGVGVLVYEGVGGADGSSHLFAVQFGSRNQGATLANWLWSRLHNLGVEVRVEGRVVDLTNDALNRALVEGRPF